MNTRKHIEKAMRQHGLVLTCFMLLMIFGICEKRKGRCLGSTKTSFLSSLSVKVSWLLFILVLRPQK